MSDKYFNYIINLFPNFCLIIKKKLLQNRLKSIGDNSSISPKSTLIYPSKTVLGNDVFIGEGLYSSTVNGLTIKDRVMLGAQVTIIGGDHQFNDPTQNMRFNRLHGNNNKIIIEHDAWIGHGSLLLKNAYVAEGTIIGAKSILTKKTLPYSIYAGQPAKFIKPRFDTFDDLKSYLHMMEERYNFSSKYNNEDLKSLYENGK